MAQLEALEDKIHSKLRGGEGIDIGKVVSLHIFSKLLLFLLFFHILW